MFTPKAISKQKYVKKTQEREKGDVVTVQLAVASIRTGKIRTQLAPTLPW